MTEQHKQELKRAVEGMQGKKSDTASWPWGKELDLLVAYCQGEEDIFERKGDLFIPGGPLDDYDTLYNPSANWEQGGPIIAEMGIALREYAASSWYATLSENLGTGQKASWNHETGGKRYGPLSYEVHRIRILFHGVTPLVAAMRCYVAEYYYKNIYWLPADTDWLFCDACHRFKPRTEMQPSSPLASRNTCKACALAVAGTSNP